MASSSNTTTATATTSSFAKYPYPSEFNVLDFVPKRELSHRNYHNWRKLMRNFILRRGMIGFIDGTAEAPPAKTVSVASPDVDTSGGAMISHGDTKIIDNPEYMSWKKSDSLVHGWILATLTEDIHLRVLDFATAREVWTTLKKMFDPTECLFELDNETDQRVAHYLPLYIATINGDWDTANRTIENEPNVVRTTITPDEETVLKLAVYMPSSVRRHHFVRKLLEKMSAEDVAIGDHQNITALHVAANVGNIQAAKMLVNKNKDLPKVLDKKGNSPLNYAAARGDREMILYLWDITEQEFILANGTAALLRDLTRGELYDIALKLLQLKPELACTEPSPFDIIGEKLSSFPSGTSFNFWQNLIYLGVPMKSGSIANSHSGGGDLENPTKCCISVRNKLHSMLWEVTEKLVPMIKHIRQKKTIHHHALELLKFLCKEVAKSNIRQLERIFKSALEKAIYVGITEIVEEIIVSYPVTLFFNWDDRNVFQYTIVCRREHVFNLVYQLGCASRFIGRQDISGNNGLHLAGHLGHHQQTTLRASATGAVLQMQRELQWFKEVEKFAFPRDKEKRNKDGMTPAEVFTTTHQELIKEGEQWMKDTATSCTIVAALIATMVFAAAITVPGGNNNENGHPLLSKQKAFIIFGVSDALALFSSITSVLMFLLILTSRYSEQDFLYILPKRLVTGLITLFVSILSTMVAFGAILYLVFGGNKAWVLIPVVALACVPVTLFGALQFPLLVEMIQSTYGKGVFGKRSDRMLE